MDLKAQANALYREALERTAPARAWLKHFFAVPWYYFRALCFSIGFVVVISLVFLASSVGGFLRSLPPVEKLAFSDLQTMAMARIQSRATNKKYKHHWLSLKDVSRPYLYSIVLSEDATYFEHEGFNFEAIVDSLAENIRERKPAFGASTISQQVVKNLFLSEEKTMTRKLREFFLTRSLESRFTKNEILEVYFNLAEFGPDIFGVGSAAWHFFRKSPVSVNAAEGCFIALMLPSPKRHYFSIFENRNLTRVRRKRIERVLRAMLYEELITEADYGRFVHYNYFPPGSPARLPARSR